MLKKQQNYKFPICGSYVDFTKTVAVRRVLQNTSFFKHFPNTFHHERAYPCIIQRSTERKTRSFSLKSNLQCQGKYGGAWHSQFSEELQWNMLPTTDRTEIIIFTHPETVFRLPTGSEVCLFLYIFQMSRAGMHISKEQVWEVLRFMLDSKQFLFCQKRTQN